MNKIRIMRKGAIKDYLVKGFYGGLISGLLAFIVSLINSSFEKTLLIGSLAWIGILILFVGIVFIHKEYFERKKEIRKLNSSKYTFLDINKFKMDQNLCFEGKYKEFWFRVIPISKRGKNGNGFDYDIITAFYTYINDSQENKKEYNLHGKYEYFLGRLDFHNHSVTFVPNDWKSPDFKSNFEGLISILKREKLLPISIDDWENLYGEK